MRRHRDTFDSVQNSIFQLLNTSAITDIRLPPPDTLGHLADLQIRATDLDSICEEASKNWPDVFAVECGVRGDGIAYLTIRIRPYTRIKARQHNELFHILQHRIPRLASLDFHCLGDEVKESNSVALKLFERTT